jgi:hypothetical protein
MTDEKPKKIKVEQFVDAMQLRSDLSYSTADLSSAMMQQASMFAHYGVLAAKASRQVNNMKMLLENTQAQVYRVVRDELTKAGEKTTESQLDKMVTRHTRVRSVQMALNEAKQIEDMAKTAVESFRHRRDMLVQHGFIQREEMKGELKIGAQKEREQSVEDLKESYLSRVARNNVAAA